MLAEFCRPACASLISRAGDSCRGLREPGHGSLPAEALSRRSHCSLPPPSTLSTHLELWLRLTLHSLASAPSPKRKPTGPNEQCVRLRRINSEKAVCLSSAALPHSTRPDCPLTPDTCDFPHHITCHHRQHTCDTRTESGNLFHPIGRRDQAQHTGGVDWQCLVGEESIPQDRAREASIRELGHCRSGAVCPGDRLQTSRSEASIVCVVTRVESRSYRSAFSLHTRLVCLLNHCGKPSDATLYRAVAALHKALY